jgi:hypothetical protein
MSPVWFFDQAGFFLSGKEVFLAGKTGRREGSFLAGKTVRREGEVFSWAGELFWREGRANSLRFGRIEMVKKRFLRRQKTNSSK